ncbi:DUF1353 domain-containing protein [Pseudomonas sp.]|uniref:DUF1353 domain-containing protein n=1 Tax=Pseudomonas sp. TaxID=306 RepID=UPI00258C7531|nr:DUF1353 domain-containing protein [Pseudomonas sp.]
MTGKFLDPLILRAYARGEWVLDKDLRYQTADGQIITAPAFFVSDLASTPWLAKPLLSGIEDRACGVIHDFTYCQNVLPREVCDALLYEMLIVSGADKARAWLMYQAVRVFGGPRYAACAGGMRVEDLAFELMGEPERAAWRGRLAPNSLA